jgi:hypothetical protein
MSSTTIQIAIARIKESSINSPLAVFKDKVNRSVNIRERTVDLYFANTVMSQRMIRQDKGDYIGTFHGSMDLDYVKQQISNAIRGKNGR